MAPLHYTISAEIFAKYPGYVRGVLMATGVHNGASPEALIGLAEPLPGEQEQTAQEQGFADYGPGSPAVERRQGRIGRGGEKGAGQEFAGGAGDGFEQRGETGPGVQGFAANRCRASTPWWISAM